MNRAYRKFLRDHGVKKRRLYKNKSVLLRQYGIVMRYGSDFKDSLSFHVKNKCMIKRLRK